MYCYVITNCYNKNYNLRLNYWLKVPRRTARDHEPKYRKEVTDLLEEIFMLKSLQDEQTAIKLMEDVTAMYAEES